MRNITILLMVTRICSVSIFVCLLCLPIRAIDFVPDFSRLGLADGLSNASVLVMAQDHHGFLWMGTRNGLNRYDGLRFESWFHDPMNPESLASDDVSALICEPDGTLWVGTWGGGLDHFDPATGKVIHYGPDKSEHGIVGAFIHCMERDDSILWIGTLDEGLVRFDTRTGAGTQYLPNPESKSNRIRCLEISPDGQIWVGTDQGLLTFDRRSKSFRTFANKTRQDPGNMPIHELLWDRSGVLWAVSGKLLLKINPQDGAAETFFVSNEERGGSKDLILALFQDHYGNIWWGCLNTGLWLFDGRSLKSFKHEPTNPQSISSDFIRALFEDRSGNLWVGTDNDGLNRMNLKPSLFRYHYHIPGSSSSFPDGEISTIAADRSDLIWIGSTSGGISSWDRTHNQFRHYFRDPENSSSLGHNGVLCLMVTRDNRLWAGTYGGLYRMEPNGSFTGFRSQPDQPDSLVHDEVLSLMEDHLGLIWIGTEEGLSRFDGGFHNLIHDPQKPDGLGAGKINALFEDSANVVWIGLSRGGLQRYNRQTETFESFKRNSEDPHAISDDKINTINEGEGSLWIGTLGRGLKRLDRDTGRFEHFIMQDGLPSNTINAILPDHRGFIWVSTNKGLSKLDAARKKFVNFDYMDGLQSNQFSVGSCLRLEDGEMFFGGVDGVNSFSPERMRTQRFLAPIVLSNVTIMASRKIKNLVKGGSLVLDHRENFIEFEFAALDYTRPENNRFSYQLEGVDPEWVARSKRPFALYTDLPHGNYTFHLRGTNHDGMESKDQIRVAIVIKPPFYRTWWAYAIYGLTAVALLWAYARFQKHRLRQRARVQLLEESERMAVEANRAKSVFLAHMSHELRTPLNLIVGYSEMVEEVLQEALEEDAWQPGEALEDLTKIRSAANYQLTLVENLLELTKIEAQKSQLYLETIELKPLIDDLVSHLEPVLEQAENSLSVHGMSCQMTPMTADPTKLRAILMNLSGNANKYTNEGLITLTIGQDAEQGITVFRVEDTGIGIDGYQMEHLFDAFANAGARAEGSGLGLYLSKHFVTMMGGRIDVESTPGQGSVFTVTLPTVVTEYRPLAP